MQFAARDVRRYRLFGAVLLAMLIARAGLGADSDADARTVKLSFPIMAQRSADSYRPGSTLMMSMPMPFSASTIRVR